MTNRFTDYTFATADTGTIGHERTLPARLSDIKNVMDYGALGDGTGAFLNTRYATLVDAQAVYPFVTNIATQTIDWAAATACFNWTSSTVLRGTIFFPPGTYVFSEPLDLEPAVGMVFLLLGSLGGSTIVGNFNDYVLSKGTGGSAANNPSYIQGLNVINNHATGGGIRFGGSVGASIRDCNITANIGLNTTGDDSADGGSTSLEFTMTNCQLDPGANTSGSIGLIAVSDGVIANCRITGFEKGVITWGQQGGHAFKGCYFEGNQIAVRAGMKPSGSDQFDAGSTFSGCHFKNNGTALYFPNSVAGTDHLEGVLIEADETVMVYGSRPQYGIWMQNLPGSFAGVVITGQYEQYAIVVDNGTSGPIYSGVAAFNTSNYGGLAWNMAAAKPVTLFKACNCPPRVYTVAQLPAVVRTYSVSGATWSSSGGGTVTISVVLGPGDLPNAGTFPVTISGVSPSGYNGTFTATAGNFFQFTYPLASDPGAFVSGGSIVATLGTAYEGQEIDISDSSVAGWGNTVAGGGSTHALIRWGLGGTNWTLVGI